ncbi:MAG TPA: DUF6390 family protein, partial [Jatrophihabitans sp.]|nr:DUF6390 family protein [Jatrophihabitans sp.]
MNAGQAGDAPAPMAGRTLFARYAYAPNDLGYCGPAESAALFELGVTGHTDVDVERIARGFSGAWPYVALLAELTGIDDPLDERVVRAYWTGGPLLGELDRKAFAARLIDVIGSQAGHYWGHLSTDLLPEVTATHGFHVFGVYPWSRLLGVAPGQPLHVLDRCRIRWGEVLAADGDQVVVRSRRLTWDGCQLGLAAATEFRHRPQPQELRPRGQPARRGHRAEHLVIGQPAQAPGGQRRAGPRQPRLDVASHVHHVAGRVLGDDQLHAKLGVGELAVPAAARDLAGGGVGQLGVAAAAELRDRAQFQIGGAGGQPPGRGHRAQH